MTERNPFEKKPAEAGPIRCEEWEMLLTEALDGLLPAGARAAFDTHGGECKACAQLLKQAKQGQEWLAFLDTELDVPTDLVERIVGKTSGSVAGGPLAAAAGAGAIPVPMHTLGLPVPRVLWDTRMMMTVAMAFFSIALTLNMTGVKLTDLRLSNLRPTAVRSFMERRLTMASTPIIRYYDHLRLVYEVQSRMQEIRRKTQTQQQQPTQPVVPGESKQNPNRKDGGSRVDPPQQSGAPSLKDPDYLETSVTLHERSAHPGGSTPQRVLVGAPEFEMAIREGSTVWIA